MGAEEFDALVIPGGYSPDKIRTSEAMVTLTRDLFEAGKPVAAICHAPWRLAEDGNLITSRKPADLEAFSQALLSQLEQSA